MRALPPAPKLAVERARALRRNATPAETMLWRALRSGQLASQKVRRQVPLGPFILDFAVVGQCLAIEVDGESHAADPARDRRRTAWLAARGWRVVRFTNAEVLGNLDGVLLQLLRALGPHPDPLPEGEGADGGA